METPIGFRVLGWGYIGIMEKKMEWNFTALACNRPNWIYTVVHLGSGLASDLFFQMKWVAIHLAPQCWFRNLGMWQLCGKSNNPASVEFKDSGLMNPKP